MAHSKTDYPKKNTTPKIVPIMAQAIGVITIVEIIEHNLRVLLLTINFLKIALAMK